MADEFDACECVWSHELAMRRLLAFIRQNQNECTDTYCLDGPNNLPQSNLLTRGSHISGNDNDYNYTMMTMLMVFALVLYFIRPQSLLSLRSKRRNSDAGDRHDGAPPAPPAVN